MIPEIINPKLSKKHKFVELCGFQNSQIALELLIKALENENDIEIRKNIRKRLKKLKYKLTQEVK